MKLFRYIGIRTDFERIFFIREFNALSGKRLSRLMLLFVILLLTLLALGYAIGGLQLLDDRMNNPYTNWVDVTVKNEDREKIDTIMKFFADLGTDNPFLLKNVTDHVIMLDPVFVSQKTGQSIELKGRTISPSDAILETILNPKDGNWISGMYYDGKNPVQFPNVLGIIATKSMLAKLGYANPENQKQIYAAENGITFLVPVEAVVEELPNYCDYCFTPGFYNLYISKYMETRFLPVERGSVNNFDFVCDNADSSALFEWWREHNATVEVLDTERKPLIINTYRQNYCYSVILNQFPSAAELDTLFNQFQRFFRDKGHLCTMIFTPNTKAAFNELNKPHYLAFNFKYLDKVEEFKSFMSQQFRFEINMAQIEAKKNFAIVSNLTLLMAVLLYLFSLASIVFFVDNLLRTHIERIKPNLGTFMAFGLSNESLRLSYLRIITTYMLISIASALSIVILFDIAEGKWTTMSKFNIFDCKILLAILFLLLVGFIKSRFTIGTILKNTPGNLIYDRET
jgi:hypothetical protein